MLQQLRTLEESLTHLRDCAGDQDELNALLTSTKTVIEAASADPFKEIVEILGDAAAQTAIGLRMWLLNENQVWLAHNGENSACIVVLEKGKPVVNICNGTIEKMIRVAKTIMD
jgi:hypothetical protein